MSKYQKSQKHKDLSCQGCMVSRICENIQDSMKQNSRLLISIIISGTKNLSRYNVISVRVNKEARVTKKLGNYLIDEKKN